MRLYPVLLDCIPPYADAGAASVPLLFAPVGTSTLLDHLSARIQRITGLPLTVIAPSGVDPANYRAQMTAPVASRIRVCAPDEFPTIVLRQELSDVLLLIESRLVTFRDRDIASLVDRFQAEPRACHHLVSLDAGMHEPTERVSLDVAGQVRGIQRHYEQNTWPFLSGVAATIMPVACCVVGEPLKPTSLTELRHVLAARNVPSRDWPTLGGAVDLNDESGFLALNESLITDPASNREHDRNGADVIFVGSGQTIHPTARIVGRAVLHADCALDHDTTIIGPAVIGPRARILPEAVVAHAVIGPDSIVPRRSAVYDAAWFSAETNPGQRRRIASYADHLARFEVGQPNGSAAEAPAVRFKRAFDVTLALVGLILGAPFLAMIAAVIWLEAEGPVFYGDEREGRGGRVFKCWKFRTMSNGAAAMQTDLRVVDQTDGPHFKAKRDPRVTRFGAFLRASNIDELPQLFNVLVGEMSLVGPRPSPFRENQICVPWREARISVRPGITGLWQVCRHDREAGDFHQWIEYDLLYVQHLTVWLDVKILIATILTLGGKLTHVEPGNLLRVVRRSSVAAQSV